MRAGLRTVMVATALVMVTSGTKAQTDRANCPILDYGNFIAYFEGDSTALGEFGKAAVERATEWYISAESRKSKCSPGMEAIYITGHTDTFGHDADNLKLSQQRAETVANEMVRLGVPSSILHLDSKGETQPAVKTGDNVREVLNSRVTIDPIFGDEAADCPCWFKG